MNCEPCGKVFTGIVSYNQHMESEKHKRKMMSLGILKNRMDNNTDEIKACHMNIAISQPVSTPDKIPCSVCGVSFNSFDSFQSHSLSLEHATNVSKKFQNNADTSSFDQVSSSISTDGVKENPTVKSGVESDTVLPPVPSYGSSYLTAFADCKVCNKQFSGPEPYKQHLVSAAHKKKEEMLNYGTVASQNFSCPPCNKIFSGQIPYQQHLVSDVHRKKLQSIKVLGELRENEINPNSVTGDLPDGILIPKTGGNELNMSVNNPWFCNICLVQCSGHIPYQQHLQSDNHWKNIRKVEAMKGKTDIKPGNLPMPNEINANSVTGDLPDGTLIPKTGENELNMSVNNPWFCNICLVQCSGHIPYQQHLQGENHWKNIRKTEAMKGKTDIKPGNLSMPSFYNNTNPEFLQTENVSNQNLQTQNIIKNMQTLNFDIQSMEIDSVLPQAMQNLVVMSADELNLKEFLPDVKIDFDKCENNKDINEIEVYEKCSYCNVKLKSKNDALSHFESVEHFQKRWN